ncbi:hypothetical protein LMH73_026490 [Vibrio splendidus]|nr:hypothetical protein [Vibrio splendidus]MCC4880883.1 hypothetical protein [Vibrio splendidus]
MTEKVRQYKNEELINHINKIMKIKFLVIAISSLISFSTMASNPVQHTSKHSMVTQSQKSTQANSMPVIAPVLHVNQEHQVTSSHTQSTHTENSIQTTLKMPISDMVTAQKSQGVLIASVTISNLHQDKNGNDIGDVEFYLNLTYPDSFCGTPMGFSRKLSVNLNELDSPQFASKINLEKGDIAHLEFNIK